MKSLIISAFREIKGSLGRYIAILAIVFLGVGFFAGLKMTKPDMVASVNDYLTEQDFYDFRLISTIGFDKAAADEIKSESYIEAAEGSICVDALCEITGRDASVFKIYSIPDSINSLAIETGRLPENPNECIIDSNISGDISNIIEGVSEGACVKITSDNEDETYDMFNTHEFSIVGSARSPLYINLERGTTSIGEGRVSGFIFVPESAFDCDYYTDIYVKTDNAYDIYTDEYNDLSDSLKPNMEDKAALLSQERYDRIVNDARQEIDDAKAELNEKTQAAENELADALNEINDGEAEIKEHEKEIADARVEISDAWASINANERGLKQQEAELLENQMLLEMLGGFEEPMSQVNSAKRKIQSAKLELTQKEQELDDAEKEIADAKSKLADGIKEYNDGRAELDKERESALKDIQEAEAELDDFKKPDSYVLNRNGNIGYVCFENDSNIVAAIANVFPVFFFLVAALITMTTMNRMVEELRTQIGILKALGYGNAPIMFKFIFYAASAALIGAISGYAAGTRLFPYVIWQAYGILYNVSTLKYVFNPFLAVSSISAALLCAVLTTYFTCRYELISAPAELIRPKAPRGGKRIFLEKITFIWNRMKFLRKVSMRNLFRYKKRFFMMIIGISGCTALLITGFGLKDSIVNIADMQYDEIQTHDLSISFSEPLSESEKEDFIASSKEYTQRLAFCHEESIDIDYSGMTKTIYLEIPENPDEYMSFINLYTEDGKEIPFPKEGEAVITAKLAQSLNIDKGSVVTLRDNDLNQFNVKITGLSKNYVYNYIFISRETYENALDKPAKFKSAYADATENTDLHSAAARLSRLNNVMSVSVTNDMRERVNKMMSSMRYIVILVIMCAGFLAFIVLYNLTNINITERIREIATIKVLGFYASETSDYVFRENLLLTGIGAAIGLLLGRLLHKFVMMNINIDMVSFKTYISPASYVYSIILTFLFAVIVDAFMFIKLEKINMAESLKSVE